MIISDDEDQNLPHGEQFDDFGDIDGYVIQGLDENGKDKKISVSEQRTLNNSNIYGIGLNKPVYSKQKSRSGYAKNLQREPSDSNSAESANQLEMNIDLNQLVDRAEKKYRYYKTLKKKLLQHRHRHGRLENHMKYYHQDSSDFSSNSSFLDEKIDPQSFIQIQKNHREILGPQILETMSQKFQLLKKPRENLSQETLNMKRIDQYYGMGKDNIQGMFQQSKQDPLFEGRIGKNEEDLSMRKEPTLVQRITLVPTEQMLNLQRAKVIEQMLTENPYMNEDQIFIELNKITRLKPIRYGKPRQISRTVMNKILNDSQFKRRKLRMFHPDRNNPRIVQMRHLFCQRFLRQREKNSRIFFVDSLNFEQFLTKDPAQRKSNEDLTVNVNHQKYSLIALFDLNGYAIWKFSGNGNKKYDDIRSLQQLLQDALKTNIELIQQRGQFESSNFNGKKFLVLDGKTIHEHQKCERLRKDLGVHLLFLPHYSPQLNPIEGWFQEIRMRVRRNIYTGQRELFTQVDRLLKEYTSFNFKDRIKQALIYAERGFRRDRF